MQNKLNQYDEITQRLRTCGLRILTGYVWFGNSNNLTKLANILSLSKLGNQRNLANFYFKQRHSVILLTTFCWNDTHFRVSNVTYSNWD